MNKAYTESANKAGELERACKYHQAKLMWQTAEQYANRIQVINLGGDE